MKIIHDIPAWQTLRATFHQQSLGFVPTMGNLHQGHLALCKQARAENDKVVVSVFVNPTQFNQASDFDNYPRTLQHDSELLAAAGVDFLLVPDASAMYPDKYEVQVTETMLSTKLEGEFRPGHFNGMLTVVLKLLNIAQATHAYFGEKDYQQLLLIKKMVTALFLPVKIIGVATVRATDELALSSRNSRLSAQQRELAIEFPRLLQSQQDCAKINEQLTALGFKVDYISETWQRRLGAVWLDEVRLIDNIPLAE